MSDTTTSLPAPGTVLPGADILAAEFPPRAVVALRVAGATYPWQRRERCDDGRWFPPVNPRAEYEVIVTAQRAEEDDRE